MCSPDWLQTPQETENSLELLNCLHPPPVYWGGRCALSYTLYTLGMILETTPRVWGTLGRCSAKESHTPPLPVIKILRSKIVVVSLFFFFFWSRRFQLKKGQLGAAVHEERVFKLRLKKKSKEKRQVRGRG